MRALLRSLTLLLSLALLPGIAPAGETDGHRADVVQSHHVEHPQRGDGGIEALGEFDRHLTGRR